MRKPVVVTLSAALRLLDYWPLRRLNWQAILVAGHTGADIQPIASRSSEGRPQNNIFASWHSSLKTDHVRVGHSFS
jgi:hypothetical protein